MLSTDNTLVLKKCIAAAPDLPPSHGGFSWGLWDVDSLGKVGTKCLCQCPAPAESKSSASAEPS